jgi:acyl transferase domain-containing protein
VLVGGANVILTPQMMASQSSLGFLSPDGRSKAFDEQADGYARGEGVGFLLLKPLGAALADGDAIRAVIRGTGVNQDGRTAGITVPSAQAQERLIRSVYDRACLDPVETPFVEAHGTGTRKGDLAEASSLASVFCHRRLPQNPLYIGSVKTNIGHLEAAAGVAQVIKTVLALENGIIPPNIWFTRPSTALPLDQWRLKVPVEPVSWPEGEKRRASINSFGYGGTNAHCVMETLEEYSMGQGAAKAGTLCQEPRCNHEARPREEEAPMLIFWSSHDKGGISRLAAQYAQYLEAKVKSATDRSSLTRRLCMTLHSRRSVMPWKSYIVSHSANSIVESFRNGAAQPLRSSEPPAIVFVFTGQGAQWPGMGRQLIRYPEYLESLQLADRFLQCLGLQVSVIGTHINFLWSPLQL